MCRDERRRHTRREERPNERTRAHALFALATPPLHSTRTRPRGGEGRPTPKRSQEGDFSAAFPGLRPYPSLSAGLAALIKELIEELLLLPPQLLLLDEHLPLHAPEGRLCQRARVCDGVLQLAQQLR